MRSYDLFEGGHAFGIAFGILLVFLMFMGGAGALSDTGISDNVLDNLLQTAAKGDVNLTKIGHYGGNPLSIN